MDRRIGHQQRESYQLLNASSDFMNCPQQYITQHDVHYLAMYQHRPLRSVVTESADNHTRFRDLSAITINSAPNATR